MRGSHALAAGICAALPRTLASALPLVLLIDGDIAMSLGRVIRHETAPGANVIAIDGVQLKQFDYVDIGRRHRSDQCGADHHQVPAVQMTRVFFFFYYIFCFKKTRGFCSPRLRKQATHK